MKKYISFYFKVILLVLLIINISYSQKKKTPKVKDIIEQIKEEPNYIKSEKSNLEKKNLNVLPLTKEQIESINIFYYDSSSQISLSIDLKFFLNSASQYLKVNQKVNIIVEGYSDSKLISSEDNQKKSEDRAKIVLQFLMSKGISKNRIISKGLANSKPITQVVSENSKNNRIEISFKNQ